MSLLDDLLDSRHEPPKRIDVALPNGEALAFEILTSYAEISQMRTAAQEFVEKFVGPNGEAKLVPLEWQPYFKPHRETLKWVYMLERLVVEKQTQLSWLKLAAKAGYLFENIRDQVATAQVRAAYETDNAEIDRLGEASRATDSGEPSSPSPATSTTDTPTN